MVKIPKSLRGGAFRKVGRKPLTLEELREIKGATSANLDPDKIAADTAANLDPDGVATHR